MAAEHQREDGAALIGGRYRIEAELGRGGTARVLHVIDERSGQALALKRLVTTSSATLQAMFEREYHTLTQLAHPAIVRTFDYGVDASGPYYTMELLQGEDARARARRTLLEPSAICLLLRDAASALALIHSRRMVHRDVSPRNLWCTPDGRAKLIDFGTLVAMGPQARVAGTPPYVPPEALALQALDARCDLYALGALGYVLLTQRDAYPARTLEALHGLWQRRPQRPEAFRDDLPPALSELVMSMLSLDARARPASAAEVCERLTAIGKLPAEDERRVAQAFLISPQLVGRDAETGFLRKRLLRAIRGRGSSVALVAAQGLGRSRMLANAILDAKLMGGAALALDARAAGPDTLALAAALAERLLEAMDLRAAVAELAPVLGHLSPAVHQALGAPALSALSPLERTRKLSSALVQLVELACARQPLLIAVDDVHRADSASLGVLGRLSLSAESRQLLLLCSAEQRALAQAPPALEQLTHERIRLALPPLAAEHTRALLESLFGAVPGLDEAASWLHELSQGSPETCMQYAQYLVDRGIARYEGGQWQLPAQLRKQGLPASLAAMLDERVRALSDDARALALGLALARDESRSAWQPEILVRIEDFPKLLDGDAARAFAALDELLSSGMVQQREPSYVLGRAAMVDALLRVALPDDRRRTHACLAEVFTHGSYAGRTLPVRQLQLAGEHRRARAAMVAFAEQLSSGTMDWGAMRVSLSSACAREALDDWAQHGGSPREAIVLRRLLLAACSAYDWSLARYGDAQLVQLQADFGMPHWPETDPALPALQRLVECLKLAQQRYDSAPEAERGLPAGEAVRELAAYAMPHSYGLAHGHDRARGLILSAALEPLRPLSPLIALLADLCAYSIERVSGRELGERLLQGIARLLAAPGLPDVVRLGGAAVTLHEQAVADARRGRTRAFELIDRLALNTGPDMFLVLHGRWLGHAFRGETALARKLLRQAEVTTEDDVWRRKAFLFVEAQLYALTGDLLELQRACAAIAELAVVFEGWRPWLAFARGELHRLRGELPAAQAELERALQLAPPGQHRAWVLAAPAHAELSLLSGDAALALRAAETIIASANEHALDRSAVVAGERIAALAHSQLGDHTAAKAASDRAFALAHELGYGGLPLAQLYEAQARVELARGAGDECAATLETLRALISTADAPALVHAHERLHEQCAQLVPALQSELGALASLRPPAGTATATLSGVQARLQSSDPPELRRQRALELLLDGSGARAGHLFLFDGKGLFEAATVERPAASPVLFALVAQYLEAELDETRTAAVTVADRAAILSSTAVMLSDGDERLLPVLLLDRRDRRPQLTGLALLALAHEPLQHPRSDLIAAISQCLRAGGDSIAAAIE